MGCFSSKDKSATGSGRKTDKTNQLITPPKWKSTEPMTQAELDRKREEFWDTAPHYGGDRVIWDALKAAVDSLSSDPTTAKLILDSAGIIVGPPDITVCYDERGAKYELPKYVLRAPTNLTTGDAPPSQPAFQTSHATPAELMGR